MQIPVLIERMVGDGYRAKGGEPFGVTVEGKTRNEALQNLRELIDRKLGGGTEVVCLDVPTTTDNPWLRLAGTLDLDDPMVKEWLAIMEENRRKADEDPDYL